MHAGCLLIHGFGGDLSEIQPLESFLTSQGIVVQCVALPGHTGIRKDLGSADHLDWIASAQDALDTLQKRCDTPFIIGFSMGGLIAANLACDTRVAGIALLSSPIFCWDKKRILRNVLSDLKSRERSHIAHYLHSTVKFPLRALLQFNLLLKKTKKRLSLVTCPVFIAQGLLDDTVSPQSAEYLRRFTSASQKTVKYYARSSHLICHSADRQALFNDLLTYMAEVEG